MIKCDAFSELEEFSNTLPQVYNGYSFISQIGKGGFSRVYLVKSLSYNQEFVAKVIPSCILGSDFISDFEFLTGISHPNVLKIYDKFSTEKFLILITEYCSNGPIKTYFKESNENQIFLIKCLYQIVQGFSFIHSLNIAHRDIKPSNILLDNFRKPKIIDFGIAIKIPKGQLINIFSGSQPYTAPEVINEEPHDPFKADIWSLGVTFYVLLVGKLPWPTEPNKQMLNCINQGHFIIPKNIDPDMSSLIRKMIIVEPELRPTMEEILNSPHFIGSGLIKSISDHKIKRKKKSFNLKMVSNHRHTPSFCYKNPLTFSNN